VEWQETGTPGAICYQIATKTVRSLTKWVKGLSRGGISPGNSRNCRTSRKPLQKSRRSNSNPA
jgi:hypothetical protein